MGTAFPSVHKEPVGILNFNPARRKRLCLRAVRHFHTAGLQLLLDNEAWQSSTASVAAKFPAVQKSQLFLIKFIVRMLKTPQIKSVPSSQH